MSLFKPEFPYRLHLDPWALRAGEVWRLLTFLFVPPTTSPLWLFLWLALFYAYARALERDWGDFKFTVYCLIGAAGTAAASLAVGAPLSNASFHASLFLAFARLNPDFEVLLFFIIPVKLSWLAFAAWLVAASKLALGPTESRAAVVGGLLSYALFFGPGHWDWLRRRMK